MRVIAFLIVTLIAVPAYSQVTIGRYRVSGKVEFDADLQIEEVVPMTTIPDPIAGWKLDDVNAAYGGFDFTTINSPTFAGGKIGDAFYTTGAPFHRYGRINNADAGLLVGANTDFPNGMTVAGWVYPTESPGLFNGRIYLGSNDAFKNPNVNQGWCIGNGIAGFGGGLFPAFRAFAMQCTSTTAVTLNQWNFVCVRIDPNLDEGTDRQEIFVNSATRTGQSSGNVAWTASTRNFNIGTGDDADGVSTFSGRLDAWYVWDDALSNAVIAALYNDGDGLELPLAVPQDATSFAPIIGASERFHIVQGASERFYPVLGASEKFHPAIGR